MTNGEGNRSEVDSAKRKQILVLYNPKSGSGAARSVLDEQIPFLEQEGWDLECHETRSPHHVEEMARTRELSGFDAILIAGGDGTVHYVINGLLKREQAERVPIGILPVGTGNAFMEHLECLDPRDVVQRLIRFRTTSVDIARVHLHDRVRYALNVVGWGIPADINARADRLRFFGKHRYTVAAILEILAMKAPIATLTVEDETTRGKLAFAMGCLPRYTGVGMLLAPKAVLDDGLIDLLVVRDPSKWELLTMFPKIFTGGHIGHPKLEYRQVRRFSIRSEHPGVLNLDGEVFPDRNITVEVLPRALTVLI